MVFQHDVPVETKLVRNQGHGNGQRNLIILLVDQVAALQPELEGIWLLITYPENPNLTLVPVFPGHPQQISSLPPYSETFEMTPDKLPDSNFLDLLAENVMWDNYLITDRDGISTMLDLFGEITMGESNSEISSAAVLQFEEPLDLDQQIILWQSTCTYLSTIDDQDQFLNLFNKLPSIFPSNLAWDDLPLYPWGQGDNSSHVDCEFPTLNLVSP